MKLVWHHFEPVLRLTNVNLLDRINHQPVMNFQQLDLGLNLFRTMWRRHWELGLVGIQGAEVHLERISSDEMAIYGKKLLYTLELNAHTTEHSTPFIEDLFTINNIFLKKIHITYHPQTEEILAQKDKRLTNQSLKTKAKSLFLDEIKIKNRGNQHLFSGQLRLEQKYVTTNFYIAGQFNGASDFYTNLNGQLYLNVGRLSLQEALQLLEQTPFLKSPSPEAMALLQPWQGRLYAQIWLHFNNDALTQVTGKARTLRLNYYSQTNMISGVDQAPSRIASLPNRIRGIPAKFSTTFQWQLHKNGQWSILFSPFLLSFDRQIGGLNSQLQFSGTHLDLNCIQAQALPIAPFFAILTKIFALQLPTRLRAIADLKPSGEITHLVWQEDENDPAKPFQIGGYFQNLAWQARNDIPAVDRLNGFFQITPHHGQIQIQAYQPYFNAAKWYSHPLNIHFFIARSIWQPNAQGKIELNSQIGIWPTAKSFIFTTWRQPLEWPAPLEVQAQAQGLSQNIWLHLLPDRLFSARAWKWLQSAVLQGDISKAKLLFFGNPKQFPFVQNNGVFQIIANLQNLKLHYSNHWPLLENFNGLLKLYQQTLSIQASQATIEKLPLKSLTAQIQPLWNSKPPLLSIESSLNSTLEKGLAFVSAHYQQLQLQHPFNAFYLQGPMHLFLKLIIPLDDIPHDSTILGKIQTANGQFHWPDWQVNCESIHGAVEFKQHLFTGKGIQGLCRQVPVEATLYGDAFHAVQHVGLTGNISTNEIMDYWPKLQFFIYFLQASGNLPFQLDFQIPDNQNPLKISLSSNLSGLEVKAPKPLKKLASQILPLTSYIFFPKPHQTNIQLKYGNRLSVASSIRQGSSGQWNVQKLALNFGNKLVDIPASNGTWITGTVPNINLAEMYQAWKNRLASTSISQKTSFPSLKGCAVVFNQLLLGSWNFGKVQAQYRTLSNGWQLELGGEQLQGEAFYNKVVHQLYGNFHQIIASWLPGNAASLKDAIQPQNFPALRLASQKLIINQKDLGELNLVTNPMEKGLVIQTLSLKHSFDSLQAVGKWEALTPSQSVIELQGNWQCQPLAKCLDAWKLPTYIESKKVTAVFNSQLPIVSSGAETSQLSGQALIQMKQGRILHLSPSMNEKINWGRILTLLSLDSLPRRLMLNFSDLTKPGFSFEHLTSDIQIDPAKISTSNTKFHGLIADIKVKGQYSRENKQISGLVAVIPHVTASIPAIAAIAGGPIVGVTAYAANKLMTPIFNQLFIRYFEIKGTLNQPKIEKIQTGGKLGNKKHSMLS